MANELSALADAAGGVVDRLTLTPAQSLHVAIARRAFEPLGAAGAPARAVHDAISTTVYSAMRAAAQGTTLRAAAAVKAASGDADVRSLSRSALGRLALGATNAIAGDHLDARGSDLAITMAIRRCGVDVACVTPALHAAFPAATGRLAVFIHGLAETDEWWQRRPHRRRGRVCAPFGPALHRDLGITPVYVRYNTGLHVSENGRRLSRLMQALTEEWPVEVREIAMVGHSMGGQCRPFRGSSGDTDRRTVDVTCAQPCHPRHSAHRSAAGQGGPRHLMGAQRTP